MNLVLLWIHEKLLKCYRFLFIADQEMGSMIIFLARDEIESSTKVFLSDQIEFAAQKRAIFIVHCVGGNPLKRNDVRALTQTHTLSECDEFEFSPSSRIKASFCVDAKSQFFIESRFPTENW
jgi:hypothetical protein